MKLKQLFTKEVGILVLLLLGFLLAISPAGEKKFQRFSPQDIINSILSQSDYVTAEQLADWIINKKPGITIIDLRRKDEYMQYHLEGAENIPLGQLVSPENIKWLRRTKTLILYSNGDRYSAQAWVILKTLGINSYYLLGGLNYWAKAILNPNPPSDLSSDTEVLQFSFRKAASQYFNKGGIGVTAAQSKPQKPKKRHIVLQEAEEEDEGC